MNSTPKPHLISFKRCPFVQRSVITLHIKNVDFDISYVDLNNKPDWFLKISPMGKVPLLQIGDAVIFESAIINEYLDEVYAPRLHPEDALLRAQNRAMVEFNSAILGTQYMLKTAKDKEDFDKHLKAIKTQLQRLESMLGTGDYVNGDSPCLVDFACAPLLQRFVIVQELYDVALLDDVPKVAAWAEKLLAHDAVKRATPKDLGVLIKQGIDNEQSYIAQLER